MELKKKQTVAQHFIVAYGYMGLWIFLSAAVIMLNKYILDPKLGGFPFPLALTATHMLFASALAWVIVRLGLIDAPAMPIDVYLRCVVPIGALFAVTLWTGNAAYLYLSVSFVQMLKGVLGDVVVHASWWLAAFVPSARNATALQRVIYWSGLWQLLAVESLCYVAVMPLLVYTVGTSFGTEKWCMSTGINLVVVVTGVVVASYGEVVFVVVGVLCQVCSMMSEATRLTLVQLLLQGRGIKLSPITTLYHVAPVCLAFLIIPLSTLEIEKLVTQEWKIGPGLLLLSAAAAFALNCSIFLLIGKTSALTMNIAGVAKDVMLIYLSMTMYGSTVTELQVAGYSIALCGAFYYNYCKIQKAKEASEKQSLHRQDDV